MATVVSLTQAKIEELMAGWEGVSLSQDQINALVQQLYTTVGTQDAVLQDFNENVVPALHEQTAAAQVALDNFVANQVPALEADISQNQDAINDLVTVDMPLLQDRVHTNELWIIDLNETILPDLYTSLDANNALINEFNTVTLPDLNTRIAAAEAAVAGVDLTGLQTDLDAAQAAIDNLNTVTLPALDTRLGAAETAVAAIDISGLQTDIDANATAIDNLSTVTIPALDTRLGAAETAVAAIDLTGLQTDIDANATAINNLNTVTLPGLNTRLGTAEGDVTALEGRFPITGPDIAADAVTANKIAADAITAREIAAHAVTAAEIAADTITAAEIAANAVTVNELAANAVIAAKIAADAVVAGKIAADAITAREIQADAITASEIAADAVTATEIAANAVTAVKIATDAVIAGKIAADAITAREIQADAITASEIAANAVTASELAADSVVAGKIAVDAITAREIAADAVTATELKAGAVIAGKIAADAVTAVEIAANAVTATELAADSVIAGKIATDAVTAREIAADAVTATEIKAGAVIAGKIAADAVTANEIAADAVTATEIAANAVIAAKIAADAVTAGKIAADAITAREIAADAITTSELAAGAVTAENIFAGAVTTDALFAGAVTAEKVSTEILIANEVFSRAGYFGTVEAGQITSGSMTAEIGVLGLLQVGEITISPVDGISVPGPNGLTLLSASGSGHRFSGAVDTDEVTINGGLTVNAKNNTINGSIQLSNVVVAPTKAPSVTRYWPYTTPTGPDLLGLTDSHDGSKWVAVNYEGLHEVQSFNKVTGVRIDNFAETTWSTDYVAYSITRAGNYYFMNMWRRSTNEWWLCRVSTTFTGFTALSRLVAVSNVGYVAVGRNELSGNPLTAWTSTNAGTPSGNIVVKEWDTAGNLVSTVNLDGLNLDGTTNFANEHLFTESIGRGLIGPNGEDQYFLIAGSSVRFFDATTLKISWIPMGPEAHKGLCIEQGTTNKLRFLGYNTYRVYEWVREANWGANNTGNLVDVAYAWYDSDVAGSGKHETQIGPVLHFADAWRWAALQIDTGAPSDTGQPDSPDSVALYINNKRQADVPVGKTSNVLRSYLTTGAAPKATNEFSGAAAYPGSVVSEATFIDGITPKLEMKGDGTGHWGDLTVDGLGKAVIGGDTGWIPITAFTIGWENYGGTYASVAYRKIGNRVQLRGLIRGPGGGGSMFTLPVGFRPAYLGIYACVMAQFSATFSATGENSPTFNTGSSGTGTSGTAHTHSVNIPTLDVTTVVTMSHVASRVDIDPSGTVSHNAGAAYQTGTNWVSLEGVTFLVD